MRRMLERTAALAIVALASACSDPAPAAIQLSAPFFANPPAHGFDVLRRSGGLGAELSTTQTVGPEGGRLQIREAGVELSIPAGALGEPVEVTMTALAGAPVAFKFAPHGLQFDVPAEIRIDPSGTSAEHLVRSLPGAERRRVSSLMGVYFEGEPAQGVEPLENLEVFLQSGAIVFEIRHFSGYACASG